MIAHCKIDLQGTVQGVGMRPWVLRQARQLNLAGGTRNTSAGLSIFIEGQADLIEEFKRRLSNLPPAGAVVECMQSEFLALTGREGFEIQPSTDTGDCSANLPRDHAMCAECRKEQRDPGNRRYRHAFISCTACGPRFTVLRGMPYDRSRTSMTEFPLCASCESEYSDPLDRRHHAQTIACNQCGPRLILRGGERITHDDASCLDLALGVLRQGGILGLKGVGGYQLLCDAADDRAIDALREWKGRQRKPLAIMCVDSQCAGEVAVLSGPERSMLESPAAPILILTTLGKAGLSTALAPGLNTLGVMLPASPLHQLLADDFSGSLVVTSGNRAGEPTLIDDEEAYSRLVEIADAVLLHNRTIHHMADDSVLRMCSEGPVLMRHARGYAPSSFPSAALAAPGVAVGGHVKSAAALGQRGKVTLLQHIGDCGGMQGQTRLRTELSGIARDLYALKPQWIGADLHPDYGSNEVARGLDLPVRAVPHHVAHVLALVAEQQVQLPAVGVAFDGAGMGTDGTLWGGEFILLENHVADDAGSSVQYCWRRIGTVLPFPLPGGEAAVREPRRAALGMAWRLFEGRRIRIPDLIQALFTDREWRILTDMLDKRINCPETSSIGRLFDAVSACAGVCTVVDYDAEAAIQLEALGSGVNAAFPSAPQITEGVWDWRPLMFNLLERIGKGESASGIAADFHASLSEMIRLMIPSTQVRVLLTGGVFQNILLLEKTRALLRANGKQVFTHRAVPPNDGALALGQLLGGGVKLQQLAETLPCA